MAITFRNCIRCCVLCAFVCFLCQGFRIGLNNLGAAKPVKRFATGQFLLAMSRILVLNSGSSSLKFKMFNVQAATAGCGLVEAISGLVERIGTCIGGINLRPIKPPLPGAALQAVAYYQNTYRLWIYCLSSIEPFAF